MRTTKQTNVPSEIVTAGELAADGCVIDCVVTGKTLFCAVGEWVEVYQVHYEQMTFLYEISPDYNIRIYK